KLFGDVLADTLELAAAGVAGLATIEDLLLARKMIRQRPASGLLACLRGRCASWRGGAAQDLKIFQHQLQLLDALKRRSEAITQLLVQSGAELGDHQIA